MLELNTNELRRHAGSLKCGDEVLLSGTVYTARDAAHLRISKLLDAGKQLPFELSGAVIYYAGPTGTPAGSVIGSIGPTTSGRMDGYAPRLYDLGLMATIGKGQRSHEVTESIVRNSAVYFIAIGGAGALYAKHIKSVEIIAFEDLGCEAIRKLEFDRFPVYVAADSFGGSIFNSISE